MKELPSVTIEGRPFVFGLLPKERFDVAQMCAPREAAEEHLAALLAALPVEQLERVLRAGTHLVVGFENLAAAAIGVAKERADLQRDLEQEREARKRAERRCEFVEGLLTVGRLATRGVPLEAASRAIYLLRDDVEEYERAEARQPSQPASGGEAGHG